MLRNLNKCYGIERMLRKLKRRVLVKSEIVALRKDIKMVAKYLLFREIISKFLNSTTVLICDNHRLMAKRQKTELSLTPQAMYNQFKKPSAGSVSELYYIYGKT